MSPSPLLLFSTLCLSASAASAGSVDYAPSSPSSLVTAAQAAEMAQHSYNELYPTTLNLSLLLGLGAFLLFVSPLVASWLASGRFLQGWMLGGRKRRKVAEEEWGMGLQRIMSAGVVVPAKVKIVSGWYANFRFFYNRVLLPNAPFMDLTIGQVIVCLAYQTIILLFLFLQAGSLIDNSQRPGYIAVAQIPAVFLLATKNSLVSIVGKGYEKLNFLHRVAGRMLVLCGGIHGVIHLRQADIDFLDPVVYTGCLAMISLFTILLTSFPLFRRFFYQLFLFTHIIGYITFLIAVNFHVPRTARAFTLVAVGALGLDFILRAAKTRYKYASCIPLSGGMTMVQVHQVAEGWRPGQHVWLRVLRGRRTLETHPFTIANAPASYSPLPGQHNLTLLAKSAGDWTRALNDASHVKSRGGDAEKQSFGVGLTVRVFVEGPYGGPMFTDFSESQAVLLLAGGTGITFAASILEELIGMALEGRIRTSILTIAWTMKAVECTDWYQESTSLSPPSAGTSLTIHDDAVFNALLNIAKTRTRLTVRIRLYITGPSCADHSPILGAAIIPSRPPIETLISDTVDDCLAVMDSKGVSRGGGVAVGTCGPNDLVRMVRCGVAGIDKTRAVKVSSASNTTTSGGIIDTVSNAASYVSETIQEVVSGASKEGNKEVAKGHTDAPVGERASAGFNAIGDKIEESGHASKAEGHKKMAEH